MSSGAIKSRTAYLGLGIINFNFPNWGDDANKNAQIVDAAFSILGVTISGAWFNSTAYVAGALVVDTTTNSVYRCLVSHTSSATGTFADDRALHPTYWAIYSTTVTGRGQWLTATQYFPNEVVFDGYVWAIAAKNFVSGASLAADIAAGNFVTIVDGTAIVTDATAAKVAAQTAKTAAETAETNAETAQAAAEAARNTAITNANTATTQAGIATTQAGISTTQAGNSASSAAASAASAAAAVVTEANTAAIYDAFDDRYLGAKSSDPTLDNDGNALLVGASYWNSVSTVLKYWSGAAWIINTLAGIGDAIHAATTKAVPVDADEFGYADSGSPWSLKKLSWAQFKTAMRAYFDTVAFSENLIVNGAFQHSQQNGNVASGVSGYFFADEWTATYTSSTGAISSQRVQSLTPYGSLDRARISIGVIDSSISAGEFLTISHCIEGTKIPHLKWGTAAAKPLLLRFGFRGPAGTYAVSVVNNAATRSYVREFVISAGQANTDTEQTLTFPGDTSGVWATDANIGILIRISLANGSTFQTTANAWQSGNYLGTSATINGFGAGNNFELFDVGAYADIYNTGIFPRYVKPDFDAEFLRCQRYFQAHVIEMVSSAYAAGAFHGFTVIFPTIMRAAPSALDAGGGGSTNASSFQIDTTTVKSARCVMSANIAGFYNVTGRNVQFKARLL